MGLGWGSTRGRETEEKGAQKEEKGLSEGGGAQ